MPASAAAERGGLDPVATFRGDLTTIGRVRVTRRVVSLLPATTEVVAALGHADLLVGRSHECDHPAVVATLPVLSRPRREPVGTSADIHRGVLELLEQVLSIYRIDADALRTAAPDLIVTQDLCRVCAVGRDEVVEAARTHLGGDVEVLTSSPSTLDEVFADIGRIGAALGDIDAGARLVDELRAGLTAVAAAVEGRPHRRVLLLEWVDPLMAGGNWAPELVEVAGADPVLGVRGGHSPIIDLGDVVGADPDVIVVAPCGYDLDRAWQEREVLRRLPGWDELTAVRRGEVVVADGSAFFNRPGPRLVESAAIVAAAVHGVGPAVAMEGVAWRRWI